MKKKYTDITIVGTGKVAYQLGFYLKRQGNKITSVWGRDKAKAKQLSMRLGAEAISELNAISKSSLALICVADTAIAEVITKIPKTIKTAYTSGSIQLEDLPDRDCLGVFYPLQTFSQDKQVDISIVPFLIESKNTEFQEELKLLAETISSTVIIANSEDRYNTHIAAVLVNNFTNFLYYLAQEHLRIHHLDFDLLKPLIKETVNKLDY